MTLWIRIGIVLFILVGSYGLGAYVRGKFEKAALADKLQEQIKTTNELLKEQTDKAIAIEGVLQTQRQNYATLNRKWNSIRASKDRNVCLLDASTISLLQSAGSGSTDAR